MAGLVPAVCTTTGVASMAGTELAPGRLYHGPAMTAGRRVRIIRRWYWYRRSFRPSFATLLGPIDRGPAATAQFSAPSDRFASTIGCAR
jgi:hypothetical protein